jgi:hypothetical protein
MKGYGVLAPRNSLLQQGRALTRVASHRSVHSTRQMPFASAFRRR